MNPQAKAQVREKGAPLNQMSRFEVFECENCPCTFQDRDGELVRFMQVGASPVHECACHGLSAQMDKGLAMYAELAQVHAGGEPVEFYVDMDDWTLNCRNCGSTTLKYEEGVINTRSTGYGEGDEDDFGSKTSGTVYIYDGDYSDGDDRPGLVCTDCERPARLPKGWTYEFA